MKPQELETLLSVDEGLLRLVDPGDQLVRPGATRPLVILERDP